MCIRPVYVRSSSWVRAEPENASSCLASSNAPLFSHDVETAVTQLLHSFYFAHDRVTLNTGDHLITKQSMAAECDINNILKQFSKTGIIQHINNNSAQYLDLPDNMDFQTSLSVIQDANDAFASLPSKVREYYHNDPGRFLGALTDPAERDRLVEYGILKPPPVPVAAPPSPPSAPSPKSEP